MAEQIRDIAEQEPEEIRQQIDETRSAITEKLEALEEHVTDTVQNVKETVQDTITTVKETVQDTVETVKETVQDTVSTVKETFDLRLQTERHPWPMMGGSFVTGFVAGALIGERRRRRRMPMDELASSGEAFREDVEPEYRGPAPVEPRRPGLLDRFQNEIDQLKGLAIGYLLSAVRDVFQENVPQYKEQIRDVMDNITTKLGGEPVRGPVFAGQQCTGTHQAHRAAAY